MTDQIPLVDYLVLGDEPHLEATQCTACGAQFFDRRNACANCSGLEFERVTDRRATGTLRSYTIVAFAAPGIDGPVRRRGDRLRRHPGPGQPDQRRSLIPSTSRLGMPVRLATYPIGTDSAGTEAIGFGFEPVTSEN